MPSDRYRITSPDVTQPLYQLLKDASLPASALVPNSNSSNNSKDGNKGNNHNNKRKDNRDPQEIRPICMFIYIYIYMYIKK